MASPESAGMLAGPSPLVGGAEAAVSAVL